MNASDVMTKDVLSVGPDASVSTVAALLMERRISAVPVVDGKGAVVGIVSEGDLLRRSETGTEKRRRWWLEFLVETGRLADDYARAHGRTAADVMSRPVVTVAPDTPLADVVELMEKHRIKRVPVVEGGKLVGLVTRSNLVRALALRKPPPTAEGLDDLRIRDMLLAELKRQPWGARHKSDVMVKDGVVHLWGTVESEEENRALRVAARNIPGVKSVRDHTSIAPLYPMTLY